MNARGRASSASARGMPHQRLRELRLPVRDATSFEVWTTNFAGLPGVTSENNLQRQFRARYGTTLSAYRRLHGDSRG